jgi:Xaa-Pro aminopeptidase
MKADLERIMSERGIGAVIVPMHESLDPSFRWLTNGAKVTRGYAVKVAGRDPLLLAYPMEREEAAASGVESRSVFDFDYNSFFRSGDLPTSYSRFFDRVLRDLGVQGNVAFFGNGPLHLYLSLLEKLEALGWQVHRSDGDDLLQRARKRKEQREIELVRSVGERTEAVVESVRRKLRGYAIVDGVAREDDRVVTLGILKRLVSEEIYRLGMIEDHETILSQGRDAAIPHSRGDAAAPLRASLPLVIDIFPADRDSGYFFDLTRTFCIGPIPERLAAVHADVLAAWGLAASSMRAGHRAAEYQNLVCDFFEQRGHATTRSQPTTLSGYVHSLGHGVGLQVHEQPSFSLQQSNSDLVEEGDILTIEPGLYFPDEEIGVRIEDTLWIDEGGRARTFCQSSKALEP